MFGLKPNPNVKCWWGARAIYQDCHIDILWDRQQMTGGTEEERKELSKWIDAVGLPELRKAVKMDHLSGGDDFLVVPEVSGNYFIMANPRKSFGYLYICAGIRGV